MLFVSIILHTECTFVNNSNAEINRGKENINKTDSVSTVSRVQRKSDFDRGYDEFLRNYHNDNGIERHGRYRVQESNEDDHSNSDETSSESVADSPESQSEESDESNEEYKMKPQHKSNKSQKNGAGQKKPTNKKTNKFCKKEKRDNMLCTICYDPKDDETAESCSYNSEPKEHNYAYSEDSSTGTGKKNEDLESFESRESENNNNAGHKKIRTNRYPVYNGRQRPSFYAPFPIRAPSTRNYGPAFYLHHSTSPSKPLRLQMTNLPSDVTVVRHRTHNIQSPYRSQRIRLITYPNQSPYFSPNLHTGQPSPAKLSDRKPPGDFAGAQSEKQSFHVTKEHPSEYLPSRLISETRRKSFSIIKNDGSKCKKFIENNKVCFECNLKGKRRKECTYKSKPKDFFESFSTSKKSSKKHKPHASINKSKSYLNHLDKIKTDHSGNNTNGAHINVPYTDEIAQLSKARPYNMENFTVAQNKRPQIIYGKVQSGDEPLYVLEHNTK